MYYFLARPPSLARRRSCWLYTSSTQQYIFVSTLVAVPPQGVTSEYKYKISVPLQHSPPLVLLQYCCCTCCVHIHRSPAVARPPLLLLVTHGYTQHLLQLYQVISILYLAWLLCVLLIIRPALRCTWYDIPLPVCIIFLLARRRSPAAPLLLVVHSSQYTAVRFR